MFSALSRSFLASVVPFALLSGACASATDAQFEEADAELAQGSAALTVSKQVKKLGEGLFNATVYGATAVSEISNQFMVNIAAGQPTSQSSIYGGADGSRAVDGRQTGQWASGSVTHTNADAAPYWQVDLGSAHAISAITIWNRTDSSTERLNGAVVLVLDASGREISRKPLAAASAPVEQGILFPVAISGRYVRVVGRANTYLSLAEVEVWEKTQDRADGVCWKQTYGRGVGTIPDGCNDQDRDAGLCYQKCAAGYTGVGPVCWQSCPTGYTDTGAFCHRDGKIISANNSSCPWYDTCGLTFAKGCSSCPAGYVNDGCTCRIDPSDIAKRSYGRGVGTPMSCTGGKQMDAGLCYTPCESGSDGVGPVCWDHCPADYPVACGAACASSQAACAAAVGEMIAAPLNAAANIAGIVASFGTTAAVKTGVQVASAGAKSAAKAAIKAQLKKAAQDLAEQTLESTAETLATGAVTGDFDWASLDPTGIASVVMAFNQPMCD